MKFPVASLFLTVSLLSGIALGQTTNQTVNKKRERGASRSAPLKICQGVPIPDGYVIFAYVTSSVCPHGAYVLKRQNTEAQVSDPIIRGARQSQPSPTAVTRPRRVSFAQPDPITPDLRGGGIESNLRQPTLAGTPVGTPVNAS